MENSRFVDQRRQAVEKFLADHDERLVRQGAIVKTWRRRGGRKLGPYFMLVVRKATGRQRAVYLGTAGPLVDEVRSRLAACRRGRRPEPGLARARRSLRRAAATANQIFDRELAVLGLYRKGWEIRGWRGRSRTLGRRRDEHSESLLPISPTACDESHSLRMTPVQEFT